VSTCDASASNESTTPGASEVISKTIGTQNPNSRKCWKICRMIVNTLPCIFCKISRNL
jgi:hypothetical protein